MIDDQNCRGDEQVLIIDEQKQSFDYQSAVAESVRSV